jgi:isopenicillin N synthase-like dioxygenase
MIVYGVRRRERRARVAIPLIDLGRTGRPLSRAVDAAGRGTGAFMLAGHGVPPDLVRECRSATRAFFALPAAEKRRVAAPRKSVLRGYFPVGAEALSYSRGVATPPDLNESFMIGPTRGGAEQNRWPRRPRGLRELWTRYYREMERVSALLLAAFASACDLPETFFEDSFAGHQSRLRARFYPAQASAPTRGQRRLGAHTDYVAFAILLAERESGGLQLRRGRRWEDVVPVEGRFIVNLGDLFELWTDGRWRSPVHRVVNPPRAAAGRDRLSLAYFHSPADAAVVAPLDTCVPADRAPRFEPVTAGDYVRSRLRAARERA